MDLARHDPVLVNLIVVLIHFFNSKRTIEEEGGRVITTQWKSVRERRGVGANEGVGRLIIRFISQFVST